jgi:hypothetical protein
MTSEVTRGEEHGRGTGGGHGVSEFGSSVSATTVRSQSPPLRCSPCVPRCGPTRCGSARGRPVGEHWEEQAVALEDVVA